MYKQLIHQRQQLYTSLSIIILILFIVAACTIYIFIRNNNHKKQSLEIISKNNENLQAFIPQLHEKIKATNDKISILEAEIERKNNFFIESLRTQVNLVTKFTQSKKTILNLITTSQLREAKNY